MKSLHQTRATFVSLACQGFLDEDDPQEWEMSEGRRAATPHQERSTALRRASVALHAARHMLHAAYDMHSVARGHRLAKEQAPAAITTG